MSKLANIVYCLIVATVTTAFGSSPPPEKVFSDALYLSMRTIRNDYRAAKSQLDALITQIESARPQQPESSNISAGCFEFLRIRAMTNKPQMIECSKSHLKSVKDQQSHLNDTLQGQLAKLMSQKTRADRCVAWLNVLPYVYTANTSCYITKETILPTIVKDAKSQFLEVIEHAKKLVMAWIPDAGLCMARAENPMPIIKWHYACKDSIEVQDIRKPTRPRVVY